MRLPRPFHQLPIRVDAARLQAEVASLPPHAWAAHPDGLPGASAVRLISAGGGEDDGVHGPMRPTPWLEGSPYLRHVLAGLGVVWGRSRLMRLAPGAQVPDHADINYNWHARVRMHVPVFTGPAVRFHCGDASVHMAAGEAWIFDNWRRHRVENGSPQDRIHLVADTAGTGTFWRMALGGSPAPERPAVSAEPAADERLLTESNQRSPVMPAAEVQLLIEDLRSELSWRADDPQARARAARLDQLLEGFAFDWRQLCLLHGLDGEGASDFLRLIASTRQAAASLATGLVIRTNGAAVMLVMDKLVMEHLLVATGPPGPQLNRA